MLPSQNQQILTKKASSDFLKSKTSTSIELRQNPKRLKLKIRDKIKEKYCKEEKKSLLSHKVD